MRRAIAKLAGIVVTIDGQDDDLRSVRNSAGDARMRRVGRVAPDSGVHDMDLRALCVEHALEDSWPHFILGDRPVNRARAQGHDLRGRKTGRSKKEAYEQGQENAKT